MNKKIMGRPRGMDHPGSLAELTKKSLMASDNTTFLLCLERYPHINKDPYLENLARRTIAVIKLMESCGNFTVIRVWTFLHDQGFTWLNLADVILLIARLRRHGYI